MALSPFLCRSAQTEEGKNGHDDHDEANEVDDAVHNVLHKTDIPRVGVVMLASFSWNRGSLPPTVRDEINGLRRHSQIQNDLEIGYTWPRDEAER
jgi:hypothetical protein